MRITEKLVAKITTYFAGVLVLMTALIPGAVVVGLQPYNPAFVFWNLGAVAVLIGMVAFVGWGHCSQREYRIFALCIGAGWFLGIYVTNDAGNRHGAGLLLRPIWTTFESMTLHSAVLTNGQIVLLSASTVMFFTMCWGLGGVFRSFTTRDRPFLTRGDTRQGASVQRARWATPREATETLNAPGGIVLGEMTPVEIDGFERFKPDDPTTWGPHGKGPLLTVSPKTGNGQVLVIQESSGYKTTGLVIANILIYDQGPMVVLDPKCNLYHRTAEARRAMGFNPVRICATDGLDPFKLLAPLIRGHPSLYYSLAKTLIPEEPGASENSIHFREKSIGLLAALLCHFMEKGKPNVLQEVSGFLARSHADAIKKAQDLASTTSMEFVKEELLALQAESEKSYPGLVAGVRNKISFAKFPDVNGFLQQPVGSTKHETILDPRTDIYIDIPTRVLKEFTPMIRLLIGALLTAAQLTEQAGRPRARRLFLLDEAKGLGSLEQLTTVRDEGRDLGLHLMLFYQSWGQFVDIWDKRAQAWEDSTETRIFGAVQSSARSNELTNILGKDTIAIKTETKSDSSAKYQLFSGQMGEGTNEQFKELPLLSQSDLSKLPRIGSLIMTRGLPPILGSKAVYFTRKDMRDRAKSEEDVAEAVARDAERLRHRSTGGQRH